MNVLNVYPKFPIQLTKALGACVWDNNNVPYLDFYGGHAVISIGHGHPYFIENIKQQLDRIGFYSNVIEMPLQEELAYEFTKLSGYKNYQLFMCNSGAEANENAIKLAYHHNKRKKIIAFKGAFHGRTAMAAALTDDLKLHGISSKVFNVEFVPFNNYQALDSAIDEDTCAVILEGIQGVGGVQEAETDFWRHVSKQCIDKGALLIVDEVQSGCGRTGDYFAHRHHGISADIITMAKGIGNGFPVGALLSTPKINVHYGLLGSTFGGNYLACAAALSVLQVLENEQLLKKANSMGTYLFQKLQSIKGILAVRGRGLMVGVDTVHDVKIVKEKLLLDHRIFVGSSGNHTIRLLPPLSIQQCQINQLVNALEQTLKALE